MTVVMDQAVTDLDAKIVELSAELQRMEGAKAVLLGGGAAAAPATRRSPGRPRGSATAAKPATRGRAAAAAPKPVGRPRGRRAGGGGTRSAQAVELIRSNPGITIGQLAEKMKIQPNYLYRVVPTLVKDGVVKKDGQGLTAA
jgi:hypothetical protein